MTKRTLLLIFTFGFLSILSLKFFGYYHKEDEGVIGFFGRLLNQTNRFQVTYNNIDKKTIDILWKPELEPSEVVVLNGKTIHSFGYVYGPQKFIIRYKGKTAHVVPFISTNNNDTHDVKINISKTNNQLKIRSLINNFETTKQTFFLE